MTAKIMNKMMMVRWLTRLDLSIKCKLPIDSYAYKFAKTFNCKCQAGSEKGSPGESALSLVDGNIEILLNN